MDVKLMMMMMMMMMMILECQLGVGAPDVLTTSLS